MSTRHRLKLWARSEEAFGAGAAVRPKAQAAAPVAVASTPPSAATSLWQEPTKQPAVLATPQKKSQLQQMDQTEVSVCTKCVLCKTRTHTVFGEGDVDAKIMFIGEGPGETEDQTGRPFVGRAGQLLDKMIAAMGLARAQVYIANIVKCRPPNNREPAGDEVEACTPYLERQIALIAPQVIVTLGRPATTYMLKSKESMGRLRGAWHQWRGIKLMATYHPSYVLRSYTPEVRAAVWSDLQQVMAALDMAPARVGTRP